MLITKKLYEAIKGANSRPYRNIKMKIQVEKVNIHPYHELQGRKNDKQYPTTDTLQRDIRFCKIRAISEVDLNT